MNKKEAQEFKKKLIDLRTKITDEIKHLGADSLSKSPRDASGDLSAYAFHMADVASDNYERELSWDRVSGEQQVLFRIDDALKRIEEGQYGKCDACGKKIGKERLKAIPYTKMCRGCQEQSKKKR